MSESREALAMKTTLAFQTVSIEVISPSTTPKPPTATATTGTLAWIAAPVLVSAAVVSLLVLVTLCLVRRVNKSRMRVHCQPQDGHGTSNNDSKSEMMSISQNGAQDVSEPLRGSCTPSPPPLELTSNWTYDSVEYLSPANQYASQGEHDLVVVRENPYYPGYSRLGGPVLNPHIRRTVPIYDHHGEQTNANNYHKLGGQLLPQQDDSQLL